MPIATSEPDPIPEPAAPRKPRRLWLIAPYAGLALLVAGYGGFWLFAKTRIEAGIDAWAEARRGAGYAVELSGRQVRGFPFRLRVDFAEARIAAPSGWSVSAPALKAEAYLHDPGHWVIAAPQGLAVVRPKGGPLSVTGDLRGSVAGEAQAPWRIVLQGTKLSFAPGPGARPFSLAGADRLEFYLRPAPTAGEGMALIRLEGGKPGPGSVLQRIVGDGMVAGNLQARLSQPAAFGGRGWADAVARWSRAGGALTQVSGQAGAGAVGVTAHDGALRVGADGRLDGVIPLQFKGLDRVIPALVASQGLDPQAADAAATVAAARASGATTDLNLVFQAGAATLGPVRIGPAPKVG